MVELAEVVLAMSLLVVVLLVVLADVVERVVPLILAFQMLLMPIESYLVVILEALVDLGLLGVVISVELVALGVELVETALTQRIL